MVDGSVTDELQLLFDFSKRIGVLDRSGLIEETDIGEVRECRDEVESMCEADVLADLTIDLFVDAFVDDGLNAHIFDDVFDREVKGDAILVIVYEFRLLLKEAALL